MILIKKAEWTTWRLVGIFLYYISLTSLFGWYQNIENNSEHLRVLGFFDLFASLQKIMGTSSTVIFLVVLFLSSLYLALRISYRQIFSHIQKTVPSMSALKETFLPGETIESVMPKTPKASNGHAKKVAELEEKIAELQSKKTPQVAKADTKAPIEPKGKKILEKMFSK